MNQLFTLLLLFIPLFSFGQQTYVPDDNFEQALINQGYDNLLDDSVLTANISELTALTYWYRYFQFNWDRRFFGFRNSII